MLLRLLLCFAAGSIPFALLAMLGSGVDIRQVGSGNPGFNNVLRVNKWRAVLTLIGDMGKGFLVVWLCKQPADSVTALWFYGFAAVLGHCFSPFLRFNGGKGIATSGGVMLVLYPLWAVVALALFTVVRVTGGKLKWREAGTLGSMAAWVSFTLLMLVFVGRQDALLAGVMTLFLAWRHKKNFQNLLATAALALLLLPIYGPARAGKAPIAEHAAAGVDQAA
ncbi:MAG: glycerol-3-phosphate acyltransferase [Acidobacteria bacterium]|nr:glycerol-3-phosphate acyltransferase [Acidobacteriota bacterium]